jgi:hypothetical protein
MLLNLAEVSPSAADSGALLVENPNTLSSDCEIVSWRWSPHTAELSNPPSRPLSAAENEAALASPLREGSPR